MPRRKKQPVVDTQNNFDSAAGRDLANILLKNKKSA